MRILTKDFVNKWSHPHRILNIHPSLLPSFRGLHTHQRVLEAGCKVTGSTVHFVVPELDAGPIILQVPVMVQEGDTPDTLAERVKQEEHKLYPRALHLVSTGRVNINGKGLVEILGSSIS